MQLSYLTTIVIEELKIFVLAQKIFHEVIYLRTHFDKFSKKNIS